MDPVAMAMLMLPPNAFNGNVARFDAKCRCCTPEPVIYMITWLRGEKIFKEPEYTLRLIPGKRTLFNWFPKDQGDLHMGYCTLTGDYDVLLENAYLTGNKVKLIN